MSKSAKQRQAKERRRQPLTPREELFGQARNLLFAALQSSGLSHTKAATMLTWLQGAVETCDILGAPKRSFTGDEVPDKVLAYYDRLITQYSSNNPKANAAIRAITVMVQYDHRDIQNLELTCDGTSLTVELVRVR